MIRLLPLLVALAFTGPVAAAWEFSGRIVVTPDSKPGIFHHLDSAGRKNIAVSGNRIAVVWEDNQDGSPQIYVAFKATDASSFSTPVRVSNGTEAYEPAIAPVGDGVFLLIWEQDGYINVRSAMPDRLGPVAVISGKRAGHGSLASWQGIAHGIWREKDSGYPRLRYARIEVGKEGKLSFSPAVAIENVPAKAPQLYPTIAAGPAGICLAWEDRRAGHTRLYYSHSVRGEKFRPPRELNEYLSNRNDYDMGSGVTRVSIAAFGEDEVLAAWMDKRRAGRGHGIFAALGGDGGTEFGPNERVHGDIGDELPHSNPSAAGNPGGLFIVAWDDYRQGSSDIWLSWYSDDVEWSGDVSPSPASGSGEQTNPSVFLDDPGNIHLAWIERIRPDAPTRIWYALGRLIQ
jgi:hypothetical protein